MKFLFDRDAVLKEVAVAQEIIANKNAILILSNVLLIAEKNTLTIRATDIKTNFETKVPVDVVEEGSTTVFCDKFINILSALPEGEVEFFQTGINVIIKPAIKKVKFQLKSQASEKFPDFSLDEPVEYFEVSVKEFKEMIIQTIFAVSNDEARYFMNGLFFEKEGDNLVMVGTDGRRLSYIAKPICQGVREFSPAIVPPKILNILLKRVPTEGNIEMSITEKLVYFRFGNYKFTTALVDGQFPNYKRVIPENSSRFFEVEKQEISEALKRVGLFVEQKTRKTIFELSDGILAISAPESDLGSANAEIPCEYAGESVTIAFNYMFVDEPLRVMESERVRFEFSEPLKPVVLRSVPSGDFFHVLMPMQAD
jgi:DNA polymerase-3 subunit beta